MGYSPRGCKESDTTERLTHTHTHTVLQMGGKQEGGRKEEKDRHFISKEFLIILSFSSYPAYEVVITENFTDEETKVQRD